MWGSFRAVNSGFLGGGTIWFWYTRWAPTSYKWSYNPYKWPYKWVTGVIIPINGVITLLITGWGPTLYPPEV